MKINIRKTLVKLALKAAGVNTESYSMQDDTFIRRLQTLLGGGPTYAGKTVDEETAMQASAVWTCVKIISETLGYISWDIYEASANGDLVRVDHDLTDVLRTSPNSDMTEVELKEALGTNMGLAGNAYSLKETRKDGSVSSLYPIVANKMQPTLQQDGTVIYKIYDRGVWVPYPREKIWHVKGFGSNGLIGFSPIGYQRQQMGIGLAMDEFQGRFFGQGARPSMVATIPDWLDGDEREKAKKNLNSVWAGLENAHKLQLLEGGIKVESVTMPFVDAQFLQLKHFGRQEIFGMYRIPPHMAGDLTRSTNNNIEQQALEFVMYCMAPYLRRIESSATKWLFVPGERKKYFLRFNIEALLRADAAGRAALYSTYVQNGIMNRNEVRGLEKLPRVVGQGMDDYTVQSNLVPVDGLSKLLSLRNAASPPKPGANDAGGDPGQPPGKGNVTVNVALSQPDVRVENVMHSPANEITVLPSETKINVRPPDVHIDVHAPNDAISELMGVLDKFVQVVGTKEDGRPSEIVRDTEGNIVGIKKVDKLEAK